jgi:hypothetical protein
VPHVHASISTAATAVIMATPLTLLVTAAQRGAAAGAAAQRAVMSAGNVGMTKTNWI